MVLAQQHAHKSIIIYHIIDSRVKLFQNCSSPTRRGNQQCRNILLYGCTWVTKTQLFIRRMIYLKFGQAWLDLLFFSFLNQSHHEFEQFATYLLGVEQNIINCANKLLQSLGVSLPKAFILLTEQTSGLSPLS